MMQNYCKTIGALAAASALVAGNALAGTSTSAPATTSAPAAECDAFPGLDYELHVGYTSEYLWRGIDLGNDLVEAGFNVASEWNGLGLSAGAWYASYDASSAGLTGLGAPGDYDIDELDLYAEVSKDLGFFTAAVGYIYYMNEDVLTAIEDAQEVYFSVSRDFGFAEASFTYFWDIETDNEGYSELALSRSFDLAPCFALNLGTSLGYQFEQAQCAAWTTKVGLDWAFADCAKLSPFVALAIALSDDNDSSYTNGSKNEFVAGSMLSVSF